MSKPTSWDSDGVDGGPSSVDMLLQWLAIPGNVDRWLASVRREDASINDVVDEIYDFFMSHGISCRSRGSISSKLWYFVHEFDAAERWIMKRKLVRFDVTRKSKRQVLRICPYYREITSLLRHSRSRRTIGPQSFETEDKMGQNVESESSDGGEVFSDRQDNPAPFQTQKEGGDLKSHTVNPKWDSDAGNGRPSSLDVLLEWLAVPGNAWRWYSASLMRDGSRHELSAEVYALLLSRGITYRTITGIKSKLGELNQQLVQAETWLENRGLRRYSVGVSKKTEIAVLSICPHYIKIGPLFHPPGPSKTTISQTDSSEAQTTDTMEFSEDQSSDEDADLTYSMLKKSQPVAKRVRSDPQSQIDYSKIKWDSDNVRNGPSSLNLLLQWLRAPGNAARWFQSAGTQGGVRIELAEEICDLFVSNGINHRTSNSIYTKLGHLSRQVEKAEKWLKKRSLRQFDVNKKTERAVLEICPNYQETAPLLRSENSPAIRAPCISTQRASSTVEYQSSDDEVGPNHEDFGADRDAEFINSKWNSDAMDGRPSSLNVLLKWAVTPGNAARWQEAARKANGLRWVIADEVYDLLLTHGIAYRTICGAESKLRALEKQFDKAETWLIHNGLRHFQDTPEAESVVLQLCPVYPMIEPSLRSAQRSDVALAAPQTSCNTEVDARFRPTAKNPVVARLSGSKRARRDHPQHLDAAKVRPVVVLDAEPEERREFFRLELQVKRDEAVLVRAKARKELLDMGLPRDEIDRIMPL